MPGKKWTDDEVAHLKTLSPGDDLATTAAMFGRSLNSVRNKLMEIRDAQRVAAISEPQQLSRREINAEAMRTIRAASDAAPVELDIDKDTRIRQLEAEVARLREQKKWETHSDLPNSTGGLLTLRESDRHNCDENHLLSCAASLEEKFLVNVGIYKPDRIKIIGGDDWIAGRGIFREQDLQSAVADPLQQTSVGAVKCWRFLKRIRETTEAPIEIVWLEGNHESAPGKTQLGTYLFLQAKDLCSDIPNVSFKLHKNRALVNLADTGFYNVLAYHGFGHSNNSPNSPKFIDSAKNDIIISQRKLPPEQHIRRVLSGHTHWLSVGLERIVDLPFDTTGGLQRNNRVQLGMNSRPVGWILYVSPRGAEGEVMKPIELRPDAETYERELSDPHLGSANRRDCAECLEAYANAIRERGELKDTDEIGVTAGRW